MIKISLIQILICANPVTDTDITPFVLFTYSFFIFDLILSYSDDIFDSDQNLYSEDFWIFELS